MPIMPRNTGNAQAPIRGKCLHSAGTPRSPAVPRGFQNKVSAVSAFALHRLGRTITRDDEDPTGQGHMPYGINIVNGRILDIGKCHLLGIQMPY